jgi:hypothetical protein
VCTLTLFKMQFSNERKTERDGARKKERESVCVFVYPRQVEEEESASRTRV